MLPGKVAGLPDILGPHPLCLYLEIRHWKKTLTVTRRLSVQYRKRNKWTKECVEKMERKKDEKRQCTMIFRKAAKDCMS